MKKNNDSNDMDEILNSEQAESENNEMTSIEEPSDKAEDSEAAETEVDTDTTSIEEIKQEKTPEGKSGNVQFYKRRSFKYGSAATAFTAVFIAIVIVINVGLSVLSSRFPISFDLTKSKDYGISAETFSFMKNVKADIKITIFGTESQMDSYYSIPKKIIDQYPKYFPNISVEYVDLEQNPTYVTKYSSESLLPGDIIVTSGSKYKKITSAFANYNSNSELYEYTTDSSTYETSIVGYKAEQAIDSAVEFVTSTTLPSVVFTQGHKEQGFSGYESFLKSRNYSTSEVNTATTAIDTNASAVVIAYPDSDFTANEISQLDTFLTNGGKYGKNLFVFLDPREKAMPNLEDFISEWGIKIGNGIVYDNQNSTSDSKASVATNNVNTTVVTNVSNNVYTLMPISRPLTLLFDTKDVRSTQYLIKSMDTAQLLENADGSPSASDKKGEYILMALASKTSETSKDLKSNVLVSGSITSMDESVLSATNFNNGNVMISLSNSLTNKKTSINIASKSKSSTQLSLTAAQRSIIEIIFIILLPLAVIITGLVIWLRRRHL